MASDYRVFFFPKSDSKNYSRIKSHDYQRGRIEEKIMSKN